MQSMIVGFKYMSPYQSRVSLIITVQAQVYIPNRRAFISTEIIEILEQAHNLNKPTRALNCLNTQNAGRSINSHNMNTLQIALQQLDIEQS